MCYFIDDKKRKKETGHIKIKWEKPKNTIVYSVRLPSECYNFILLFHVIRISFDIPE